MRHDDHLPGTAVRCEECWGVAYEPGWYAVLRVPGPLIDLSREGAEPLLDLSSPPTWRPVDRPRHD
jgi:hypothetical protein